MTQHAHYARNELTVRTLIPRPVGEDRGERIDLRSGYRLNLLFTGRGI
jgi:hypothetical protein